jgi:hypothetical protein
MSIPLALLKPREKEWMEGLVRAFRKIKKEAMALKNSGTFARACENLRIIIELMQFYRHLDEGGSRKKRARAWFSLVLRATQPIQTGNEVIDSEMSKIISSLRV